VSDGWVLAYDGLDPAQEGLREALCALGNGRFVTRGAAEEAVADGVHYPGTYVAGGYNQLASDVAGRTVVNEDLVNFPNWLGLTFRPADGAWLDLTAVQLLEYRQELRLRDGLLLRRFRIRDGAGRETAVATRRLVHMGDPHLAAIDYRVTPVNWTGEIELRASLDGAVTNQGVARYRQLNSRHLRVVARGRVAPEGVYLLAQTTQSRFEVALAARTRLFLDGEPLAAERHIVEEGDARIGEECAALVPRGGTLRVEKVASLFTSRDRGITESALDARLALSAAPGFDELLRAHRRAWAALWRRYDIELETGPGAGAERDQLVLRLHVFHLLQTVSLHTIGLDVGAPARGLHGEAYRGHVFWDELFILPFFTTRTPTVTRSLLLYRYHRLPAARAAARAAGFAGAMYPWQSSSDGREATQTVHLNPRSGQWDPDHSHLQRHVNAAIAYNTWTYYHATGDAEFLDYYGAEMLLEIARFWAGAAVKDEATGRWGIHRVMGPDEYHEKYPGAEAGGLRNNAYTNVMAVWCLHRAFDALDALRGQRRIELLELLEIEPAELDRWREIGERMTVPFFDGGIIEQFEGYRDLAELDWDAYRRQYGNIERMDRILRAEGDTPDRYKVSKQADADMLFYLLEPEELCDLLARLGHPFDADAIARNVAYYRPRTSDGSTLSKVVLASVMHHLDPEEGGRLFLAALGSDIDDVQGGTTAEGVHLGAMAGTVDIVMRHYAGLELGAKGARLSPDLPRRLRGLRFRFQYRGRWYDVEMTRQRVRVAVDDGGPDVEIEIGGHLCRISAGSSIEVEIAQVS
jgi:trehalose/maltose hydrolase-like predicted phosphorylase